MGKTLNFSTTLHDKRWGFIKDGYRQVKHHTETLAMAELMERVDMAENINRYAFGFEVFYHDFQEGQNKRTFIRGNGDLSNVTTRKKQSIYDFIRMIYGKDEQDD